MNDVKIRLDSISSFPRDIEPPQVQQWVNREEFMRVAVHGELANANSNAWQKHFDVKSHN